MKKGFFKRYCKENKIKMYDIASQCQISVMHLYEIDRGLRTNITFKIAQQIYDGIGVLPEQYLNWEFLSATREGK